MLGEIKILVAPLMAVEEEKEDNRVYVADDIAVTVAVSCRSGGCGGAMRLLLFGDIVEMEKKKRKCDKQPIYVLLCLSLIHYCFHYLLYKLKLPYSPY